MNALKHLFAGLFAILAISCSNEVEIESNEPSASENYRTLAEAANIATKAADNLYNNNSRGYGHKANLGKSGILKSDNSRGETSPLLYIVNFENNGGYAIVSAPKIQNDVFAVVEKGNYDITSGSDNPGLNYYLEAAEEYTKQSMEKELSAAQSPPL